MNYYRNDIKHNKGDTYSSAIVVEGLGQAVDSIYFTCRENLNDNAEVLFQSGINNGISLIEYDEEKDIRKYAVRIAPSKTRELQSGTYYYDLEVGVNGDIFTIMKGRFILEQDSTREDNEPDDPLIVVIKNTLDEINGETISEDVLYDLNYVEETKTLIKEELNNLGAGIENTDTFRNYVNFINNIYYNYPKVTEEGTSIIFNTNAGKMILSLNSNDLTQNSTPSPTSSVEVNTITEDNNINITNSDSSKEQNFTITLGSIEYCKIGNYADQIFKNTEDSPYYDNTLVDGDWYIKKNTSKITYTGSETGWNMLGMTNGKQFYINQSGIYHDNTKTWLKSNYFIGGKIGDRETIKDTVYSFSTGIAFNPTTTVANSLDEWKTWLSTHNTTVYYPIATSTYMHITQADYSTLYSELENIYNNAKSYDEETNITQTNDNLSFNIEATALMKGDE